MEDKINTEFTGDINSKKTVLIVDDDATICSITKLMVEKAGFRALTAMDGMDAIKIMTEIDGKIDCMLLDHTMPNMNGLEAYNILKAKYPHIKVVMMSGYNLQEISASLSEQGIIGHISKPYSMAVLIQALTAAMTP
jgi:two-component system, cell cycle sensor histidine kinase and response regulator CckA